MVNNAAGPDAGTGGGRHCAGAGADGHRTLAGQDAEEAAMAAAAISGDMHEAARPRRVGLGAAIARAVVVQWIWLQVSLLWLVDLGPLRRIWYRARGKRADYARVTG